MNLTKTLTIGAAALGWLTLAGLANAAPPGSSSGKAKYAAATSYESGQRSSRPRSGGRSAFAPARMEARCDAKGGRLIQGRGGEWRCILRGGRTVYTPRGRHFVTREGHTIFVPRGKSSYHERGMRGGRSAYEPRSGRSGATQGRSSEQWKGQMQKQRGGQEGQSHRM